jgi:small conductance mechanosensitive channel
MIEELIIQAQAYISQRYLPWSLAAIGLVVGSIIIRVVNHHLGKLFSTVGYDRTLEILCQRSVKWFLWVVLISLIAGNLGFNVSGFIAGLSVTGFVVGFAVKDVLANLAAGMFILIKRPFVVGETVHVAGITGEVMEVNLAACILFSSDNETVTIPNANVWGNPIKNASRNTRQV